VPELKKSHSAVNLEIAAIAIAEGTTPSVRTPETSPKFRKAASDGLTVNLAAFYVLSLVFTIFWVVTFFDRLVLLSF
jgi:hypothetical protein